MVSDCDSFTITVSDESVTFTPSGPPTRSLCEHVVLLDSISRSSILSDMLDAVHDGDEIDLPKGDLSSWLQSMDAMNVQPASADGKCNLIKLDVPSGKQLLLYVKAADFLQDQDTLNQLCHHTGAWLFEGLKPSEMREEHLQAEPSTFNPPALSEDRKQLLKEISENLLVPILQASPASFPAQLARLPHSCHTAALHAAFPSISADGTLALEGPRGQSVGHGLNPVLGHTGIMVLWPLVSNVSSALRHLDIIRIHINRKHATSLGPHLACLSLLQRLNMQSCRIDEQAAQVFAPYLSSLTSMQHLNLSFNSIGEAGATALAPHLAKLTSLTVFNLSSNRIGKAGATALAPHLAKLTSLSSLGLGSNSIGDAGKQELRSQLHNVRELMLW